MRLGMLARPLWAVLARAVKERLHKLVDSIDEEDLSEFKARLHERIERL